MTTNPTTKGMSEILAVLDDVIESAADGLPVGATCKQLATARSTIESTFAELAELRANAMLAETSLHHSMSSAMALEERAVVAESDRTALADALANAKREFEQHAYDFIPDEFGGCIQFRHPNSGDGRWVPREAWQKTKDELRVLRAELKEAHDLLAGVGEAQIFAIRRAEKAESDRTAMLEVVRRLLPYARDAEVRTDQMARDVRDAEAILSRIEATHVADDSGPDFSDGCDSEGFPGGCKRFGHTPGTCPNRPTAPEASR